MTFRIELSPEANDEIEEAYRWIADHSPGGARRWYNGLMRALHSLRQQPARCPLAPESRAVELEIHQLLYGRRWQRFRILFAIQRKSVRILHVRHGARRHLDQAD